MAVRYRPEALRHKNNNLDTLIEVGHRFPVLDKGHVRVVDYMGGDEAIVQAARVSYGKGTKTVSEDRGLIRYLMRHYHSTPFEMCELKLHVRVPMDCWRQWIRHRTASVNEYSTRYSEAIDDKQATGVDQWRLQSKGNKQGSGEFLDPMVGVTLTQVEKGLHDALEAAYKERLDVGVAREQARKDLPLSTYTEAYWKCNLHNLLHFLSLRMDSHAQKEIRDYANVIGNEIVKEWVPHTWAAFLDYRFGGMFLSRMEQAIVAQQNRGGAVAATEQAEGYGWLKRGDDGTLKSHRERQECERKLNELGFRVPW